MKRLLLTLACLALAASAPAQMRAPSTGINARFLKFFGDVKEFSGNATVRMLDKDEKETATIPMTIALRDQKLRFEMDLSQAKMAGMPPEAAGMLKQAGVDKMVTLILGEKKTNVLIYPGAQAYAEMPFTADEAAEEKDAETEVGEETIDGHPCLKMKFTSTDAKGKTQEGLVWRATKLKKFPLQTEMPQRSGKVIVKFQTPKLEAPDAAIFTVPSNYTRYENVQALMQAAMLKMFSNGGAGGIPGAK